MPMIPDSASGVSTTRCAPNSLEQSVGDAEDAAELADVLAHDEDLRVVGHRASQALVDRLRHRELDHVRPPRRRREAVEVGAELGALLVETRVRLGVHVVEDLDRGSRDRAERGRAHLGAQRVGVCRDGGRELVVEPALRRAGAPRGGRSGRGAASARPRPCRDSASGRPRSCAVPCGRSRPR